MWRRATLAMEMSITSMNVASEPVNATSRGLIFTCSRLSPCSAIDPSDSLDFYFRCDRQAGREKHFIVGIYAVVENDFDWDALDNFDKISRGIFWRKNAKARARAGLDGIDVTFEFCPAERIHFDCHRLSWLHVFELCFLEIGCDPYVRIHQSKHSLAGLEIGAGFDGSLRDTSRTWRANLAIAEIDLGAFDVGLRGAEFAFGSFDRGLGGSDIHFRRSLARFRLFELSLGIFLGGNGIIELLAGTRALVHFLKTLQIAGGIVQCDLCRLDFGIRLTHCGLRGVDLRLCLSEPTLSGKRLRVCLLESDLVIRWVQFNQQITLVNELVVGDVQLQRARGNLRTDLRDVAINVCIICGHVMARMQPIGDPADNDDDEKCRDRNDYGGSFVNRRFVRLLFFVTLLFFF